MIQRRGAWQCGQPYFIRFLVVCLTIFFKGTVQRVGTYISNWEEVDIITIWNFTATSCLALISSHTCHRIWATKGSLSLRGNGVHSHNQSASEGLPCTRALLSIPCVNFRYPSEGGGVGEGRMSLLSLLDFRSRKSSEVNVDRWAASEWQYRLNRTLVCNNLIPCVYSRLRVIRKLGESFSKTSSLFPINCNEGRTLMAAQGSKRRQLHAQEILQKLRGGDIVRTRRWEKGYMMPSSV